MTLKGNAIFKEKLASGLKKAIRNLEEMSEILHFDGLLLSEACNVWAKNIELCREKWLMVSKMT